VDRLDPYRWAVWIAAAVLAVVLFLVGQPTDTRQALALAAAVGAFAAVVALLWRATRRRMDRLTTARQQHREVGGTVLITGAVGLLALIGSFVVAQAVLPDQVLLCGRAYNSGARSMSATDLASYGPLRRVGRSHGIDLYAPLDTRESGSCQGQTTTFVFTKDLDGRWHNWDLVGGP
jgi:hypothetical protein